MNWGHKIAIVFGLFVVLMVYMVYQSFQVNIDLVAEDYYQQELVYQDKIDKINNTQDLAKGISLSQANGQLTVAFPDLFGKEMSGNISLFRPSDARYDLSTQLKLDNSNRQQIATKKLAKGYYKVQLDWQAQGKAYYHEESVYID